MIHIREVYFKLLSTKLNYKNSNAYIYIFGAYVMYSNKNQVSFFLFSKNTKEDSWNFPKGCLKDKYPLILIRILGTTMRNCPYS